MRDGWTLTMLVQQTAALPSAGRGRAVTLALNA